MSDEARRKSDEARAFWVVEPGRGEIRRESLRPPAGDEVVVRALYSGISRGTEALVFQGRAPESEWARMRAPFRRRVPWAGQIRLRAWASSSAVQRI